MERNQDGYNHHRHGHQNGDYHRLGEHSDCAVDCDDRHPNDGEYCMERHKDILHNDLKFDQNNLYDGLEWNQNDGFNRSRGGEDNSHHHLGEY